MCILELPLQKLRKTLISKLSIECLTFNIEVHVTTRQTVSIYNNSCINKDLKKYIYWFANMIHTNHHCHRFS